MKRLRLEWTGNFSLNNKRVGAHWRSHQAENVTLKEWARMAASDDGTVFDGPVTVEAMTTYPTGVLPDADAIALVMKYVLDGIVLSGAIPDDTGEYVRSMTYYASVRDTTRPRSLIVLMKEAAR